MSMNRRSIMRLGLTGAFTLAAPAILRAEDLTDQTYSGNTAVSGTVVTGEAKRHNTAMFRAQNWQDHFKTLRKGAILCDLNTRVLHYWSEDESVYLAYPSSVPINEDLTRRGYTQITLKRRDPTWIPTPNMLKRDPTLPRSVGPGPDNPLGSRALNLGWQYYRIHGIDKLAKIGRPASNGCVGLYNEHAERLFDLVEIGTQVRFL